MPPKKKASAPAKAGGFRHAGNIIIPMDHGRYARVAVPDRPLSRHVRTDSAVFWELVAAWIAAGQRERLLAELATFASNYPEDDWRSRFERASSMS